VVRSSTSSYEVERKEGLSPALQIGIGVSLEHSTGRKRRQSSYSPGLHSASIVRRSKQVAGNQAMTEDHRYVQPAHDSGGMIARRVGRRFGTLILGAAVAAALTLSLSMLAGAEETARQVPRVGSLWQGDPSAPINVRMTEAFRQGLRERGRYEGENIAIEYKHGDLDNLALLANDLVRLNVDVILAAGTPAALAAKRATTKIPIVGTVMADPPADGLVASLARPGGNITGNTFLAPELGPKRLQLLREVIPGIRRLAVLQHPGVYTERTMREMLEGIRTAIFGIELHVLEVSGPNEFETVFAAMAKTPIDALIIFPSPMFYVNHRRLVDLAAKHQLPAMYVFSEAVEDGGLMSYGANIPDLVHQAAAYVDKILRGAKPADLPVEQPTKLEFMINMKAAKALGLPIPQSLLLRADRVIE
jgi:ABC-type uncharacterized transport system substrate-binding protein